MFVRAFSLPPQLAQLPPTRVELSNSGDSFTAKKPTIRHFVLPAGDDPVTVKVSSVLPVDIRILATAIAPNGARPHYGAD